MEESVERTYQAQRDFSRGTWCLWLFLAVLIMGVMVGHALWKIRKLHESKVKLQNSVMVTSPEARRMFSQARQRLKEPWGARSYPAVLATPVTTATAVTVRRTTSTQWRKLPPDERRPWRRLPRNMAFM